MTHPLSVTDLLPFANQALTWTAASANLGAQPLQTTSTNPLEKVVTIIRNLRLIDDHVSLTNSIKSPLCLQPILQQLKESKKQIK